MKLTLFDKLLGGGLLAGKKTYLGALGLAVAALISYLGGDIGLAEVIMRLSEALGVAGLRAGISKSILTALAAAASSASGGQGGKPATPPAETGARLQAAWPATLVAVFLALVLAGCVSSTVVPRTPAQRFYAAEADYKSLINIAVAYKRDCVAKPADLQFGCGDVVAEIQRIDAEVLFPLIVTGRAAVASGDDLRIAAARHAVTKGLNELRRYLISQGLTQSGAVLLPAEPGPGPPGVLSERAGVPIDWRKAA